MPVYDFKCASCGHVIEEICKVGADYNHSCPECGKIDWIKRPTTASFNFKGNGFYETDYKKTANSYQKENREENNED